MMAKGGRSVFLLRTPAAEGWTPNGRKIAVVKSGRVIILSKSAYMRTTRDPKTPKRI